MAGIEAGNAGMTENDAHYRSKLFDAHKDEFLRGYHEAVEDTEHHNPRVYHGTSQETAFVAKTDRSMRNWESIGTWVTNDLEHAKAFGNTVYQVECPDTLKLMRVEDPDNLTEPFLTPGLNAPIIPRPDKVILKAAFVEAPRSHPFYGKRSYEFVQRLYKQTERRFHKADDGWGLTDWMKKHKITRDFILATERTLLQARNTCYRLSHSPEYIAFLYTHYTSQGIDGLAWENTAMDSGLHGSDDRRQTQYLLFYPEKYMFSQVASS